MSKKARVSKSTLIDEINAQTNIDKKVIRQVLNSFNDLVWDNLYDGMSVSIDKFGRFDPEFRNIAPNIIQNLRNGSSIDPTLAYLRVVFKPSPVRLRKYTELKSKKRKVSGKKLSLRS